MNTKMYFGNNGITATHAAHIKNMCKELIQQDLAKLDNLNVVNEKITLIGSANPTVTSVGITSLDFIKTSLESIVNASALSAWLGEAIKAKDTLLLKYKHYNLDSYLTDNGIKLESPRKKQTLTEDDIISKMSVSARCNYLATEARAAQLGKIVHPNGSIASARKTAINVKNIPNVVTGSGQDSIVKSRELSIPDNMLEEMFFDIQNEYRKAQSQLNFIKSQIKKDMDKVNTENNDEYVNLHREYSLELDKYATEFNNFIIAKRQEISNLKIVIPDELKEFYKQVDLLGK